MFDRLARWLRPIDPGSGDAATDDTRDMALAACALLVETAMMDGQFDAAERATVARLVGARFSLAAADGAALVAEAERAVAESPQIFGFTNAVKSRFDENERVALMEMLWEVAYADGIVHEFEENLLRRIGGLIYVSDRDRGLARQRVRERLGKRAPGDKPAGGVETR